MPRTKANAASVDAPTVSLAAADLTLQPSPLLRPRPPRRRPRPASLRPRRTRDESVPARDESVPATLHARLAEKIPEAVVTEPTHQIEGVDLRSVASLAVRFYAGMVLAVVLASAVVWLFASVVGIVGKFEELMRSIGFAEFHVVGLQFLGGALILAVAVVVFLTVVTVLAAAFYNVLVSHGHTVTLRMGPIPTADSADRAQRDATVD